MDFKGSETEANLRRAFSGEAHTRSKYGLYAEVVRREGYEQLAALFEETAGNELAHARMWLRALEGLGTTEENLLDAAGGGTCPLDLYLSGDGPGCPGGGVSGAGRPV